MQTEQDSLNHELDKFIMRVCALTFDSFNQVAFPVLGLIRHGVCHCSHIKASHITVGIVGTYRCDSI